MCPSHDPLRWSAVQMSAAAIPRAKAKLLQFKVPGSTLFFRVFTHVPSVNIYIYITYYILHIIYYILNITYYILHIIYYILYITYYMLHVHIYIYIYSLLLHIYIYIYMVTPKSDDSWQLSLLKLSLDTTWGAHHGFLDLPGTGQFSGVVKAFNAKGPGSREWFPSAPHLTVLVSYLHGLWGLKKLPDVNEELYWVL